MKVAICHQTFAGGDAIGNDMAGMYRLLEQLGVQPTIVCEWSSQADGFCLSQPSQAEWDSFELIIYHHRDLSMTQIAPLYSNITT